MGEECSECVADENGLVTNVRGSVCPISEGTIAPICSFVVSAITSLDQRSVK